MIFAQSELYYTLFSRKNQLFFLFIAVQRRKVLSPLLPIRLHFDKRLLRFLLRPDQLLSHVCRVASGERPVGHTPAGRKLARLLSRRAAAAAK